MTKKRQKIHVVSYTHWDREFRFDFESTRMWLVRLMDNLLSIMQGNPDSADVTEHVPPGPSFKHYTLDGQFVMVEDYLEIRPEARQELQDLVRQGRVHVGPWYTLPDSSSVHGESLVRNLMTGLRKAREFGGAMEIGYNVFSFGQISQLPQIYEGFGIDFIMFYKHMDPSRSRYDEFIWEAPDGTQAYATHLGQEARWNFFFGGHIPIVYDRDPWHESWQWKWGDLGKSFHACEPERRADFHYITEPETSYYRGNVKTGFQRTIETLANTAVPEHLLFFDGTDFTEPHPLIPDIIEDANEQLGDDYEVVHSSFEDYVREVKPLLKERDLDVVRGAMRDGPVGAIHTDVCSIHPELKRANGEAEKVLFRLAEPLATVAWMNGTRYPARQIERTLEKLFYSQAHDSLHGVGPRQMIEDVKNRLSRARTIAQNIADFSLHAVCSEINTSGFSDGEVFLTVFNPAPFARSETIEAYIDIPREANVDELYLEDIAGNRINLHVLDREETRSGTYHPRNRNMPFYITRFHVIFSADNLPATGYTTYTIRWKEKDMYPYPHEDFDPVRIPANRLATGPQSAENETVKITFNPDGTFDLTNKKTGREYNGLNYILDSGDAGNLQIHLPPATGEVISSEGHPARISLLVNDSEMAKFRVEREMELPCYYDHENDKRSDETQSVEIISEITLTRSSPVLEIETTVNNTVKDHFMRVCFPTGIQTDTTAAGSLFNVEHYPTRRPADGQWEGPELKRHQQHMFMDIADDNGGLAILNDTLRDYEVLQPENGVVAQSLVRSVDLRIPVDNRLWKEYPDDDSAQSLGEHTIRYGLYPHAGRWDKAGVLREAVAFSTPMRIGQIGRHGGSLSAETSFLKLEGDNLVMSAFKRAEDRQSAIVRLYNPADEKIRGRLQTDKVIKEAYRTNLNEERTGPIELKDDHTVEIQIDKHKIITVELVF